MPKAIAELADAMLHEPARVAVTPVSSTAERISQRIIQVDHTAKAAMLAQILSEETIDRALVFTRTKHGADKVVKSLAKCGIAANAIHGNKSQNHRERVLTAFRSGEVRTLIATDIAARGIDVDGVSHVVNFDLPNVPETYVHRIGRTARAGREGTAISLVAGGEEMAYLRDIERLIRIALPREDRRTPGQRDAAPAQTTDRSVGRAAHPHGHAHGHPHGHSHGARANDGAQLSKGPRRRRRGGGKSGALQANRPELGREPGRDHNRKELHREPQRAAHGGGKPDGKGLAFLHRETRPNNQRKRDQRPR
jgi:superfamily II DNA/RNA helicase